MWLDSVLPRSLRSLADIKIQPHNPSHSEWVCYNAYCIYSAYVLSKPQLASLTHLNESKLLFCVLCLSPLSNIQYNLIIIFTKTKLATRFGVKYKKILSILFLYVHDTSITNIEQQTQCTVWYDSMYFTPKIETKPGAACNYNQMFASVSTQYLWV